MAGSDGTDGRPGAPTPPAPGSLAPPWAPVAAALATLFTVALSGRVWHSTGLPGVDAWMLDLLGAQSDERQLRLATEVASGLRALTVAGILATALVAWRVLRWWSAVALALLAPAATLAAERLLKLLVARRAPGSLVFQYPVGAYGGRDRAGPQPGADPPSGHGATPGQAVHRAVRRAPSAADGLGAPGRDGAPADRRHRRGIDRRSGDAGHRPPARPVSPGRTPRAPCPWSREGGRTAGRPRAPAARPRPPRSRSCRGR
jgi:hypothetical protein